MITDDTATLPQLVEGMNDDKINAQIQGDPCRHHRRWHDQLLPWAGIIGRAACPSG
jgi:hypothetical protein